MNERNNVMFVLFLIFLFFNLADMVTTYFILPGEANPIVTFTKMPILLYLLKIGITIGIWLIIRKNEYPTHFTYYTFIVILVYGSAAFGFGVYSNVQGILDPSIVETASQLPQQVKTQAYIKFALVLYYIPVVLTLVSFKIYEISLNKVLIHKQRS